MPALGIELLVPSSGLKRGKGEVAILGIDMRNDSGRVEKSRDRNGRVVVGPETGEIEENEEKYGEPKGLG